MMPDLYTSNEKMVSREIFVSGWVQGVGYRAWIVRQAHSFGLSGYTENLKDKRVHIIVCGESTNVNAFETLCGKGPVNARVNRVETLNFKGKVKTGFEIKYDVMRPKSLLLIRRILKKIRGSIKRFII